MRYILTSELFTDEENYQKIFFFMSLVAQKNFQIVFIEDEDKFENFKKHFSKIVLNTLLQKIQKDLKLFMSRKSNIFRIGLKKMMALLLLMRQLT
ncbi:hypothetical protein NQ779_15375 [Acinetobacter baumannii]|nr:hypothetical protein [Acinetobacter baumannii]